MQINQKTNEIDNFPEKCNLPRLTLEQRENPDSPLSMK